MIEKLKSQLEAAHRAKESHAAKLTQRKASKQVCSYLLCFVHVNMSNKQTNMPVKIHTWLEEVLHVFNDADFPLME